MNGTCPRQRKSPILSLFLSSAILFLSDSCSLSPRIQESQLLRAAKENDLCILKKLLLDQACDFGQRGGVGVYRGGDRGRWHPSLPQDAEGLCKGALESISVAWGPSFQGLWKVSDTSLILLQEPWGRQRCTLLLSMTISRPPWC